MTQAAKVIVFAGSARSDSLNKRLASIAAEEASRFGAHVTYLDLREYEMPIYDGDLESSQGLPENAVKLKQLLKDHDAMIISSPEYNSSISPLLKNVIDWCSRASDGEAPLAAFSGKTAALLSASPGALGGLRGLVHLRSILGNIGVLVTPDQLAVGSASGAFDENGRLADEKMQKRLTAVVEKLVNIASKVSQ